MATTKELKKMEVLTNVCSNCGKDVVHSCCDKCGTTKKFNCLCCGREYTAPVLVERENLCILCFDYVFRDRRKESRAWDMI